MSTVANKASIQDGEELIAFPLLFSRQLKKTPNNTAIVFEDQSYTYLELERLSNQFQQAILNQNNNLLNDTKIGICIDKSPEAIAAMLGIMKSGAAFVPLDPEYPLDRIAYMIKDANIQTIISQPNHQENLFSDLINRQSIHWINCFQPLDDNAQAADDSTCKREIKPSDLAYIMYTSGSTGKPKGVQIEHAALATYCYADIEVYKVEENDRTLQFSTINFDIAIEEIFPPLLTGSCVVIRPATRSDSLNELSTIINKYQVSAVHIATAYWHEWVDLMIASNDHIPESLRLMVVTGEKVSTKHYQHWKTLCKKTNQQVLWCNAYGPTEATVSASVFIPEEDFDSNNMPIGKPLKRYTALIVDENYKNLPEGETGQLLIGGPALARGYLNRPELNDDVFVEVNHDNQQSRMYKTGDLARWLPNGDIDFAGRIDHQIKLGSYRIEPGEIEVEINHHHQVLESLISYDEVEGKKALIAYVAKGDNTLSANDLSQFLQASLPAFMVPARYIFINHFPKTTNGKIDRKALPDISKSEVPRTKGFIAPRNDLEQQIANMWKEVLRLPEIGIHDDFFALGGSSLLAVGVVSRLITSHDLELPVRDFFSNPTIASLARHISQMLNMDSNDYSDDDSQAIRDRLPKVIPAFFGESESNLYGVHYSPKSDIPSQSHAVLMCHPIGHEYPRSYRNLQQLALQLGQFGFDVFRFDYAGTGNSYGDNKTLTAESCANDIEQAAEYLRQQSGCDNLSIIGVRTGASFTLKSQIPDIENLILWDPVMQGSKYLNMLEAFHHRALTMYKYFITVRNYSSIDQLLGQAMSVEKRQSLFELDLLSNKKLSNSDIARRKVLITSKGYLQRESSCDQLLKNWEHFDTVDDIHWHDPQFTESAFSSPDASQKMISILKNTAKQKDHK